MGSRSTGFGLHNYFVRVCAIDLYVVRYRVGRLLAVFMWPAVSDRWDMYHENGSSKLNFHSLSSISLINKQCHPPHGGCSCWTGNEWWTAQWPAHAQVQQPCSCMCMCVMCVCACMYVCLCFCETLAWLVLFEASKV
jgi:hypothetical protein